jgi:hypothetical protein
MSWLWRHVYSLIIGDTDVSEEHAASIRLHSPTTLKTACMFTAKKTSSFMNWRISSVHMPCLQRNNTRWECLSARIISDTKGFRLNFVVIILVARQISCWLCRGRLDSIVAS